MERLSIIIILILGILLHLRSVVHAWTQNYLVYEILSLIIFVVVAVYVWRRLK